MAACSHYITCKPKGTNDAGFSCCAVCRHGNYLMYRRFSKYVNVKKFNLSALGMLQKLHSSSGPTTLSLCVMLVSACSKGFKTVN